MVTQNEVNSFGRRSQLPLTLAATGRHSVRHLDRE
jgi:hypothetical protein